MRLQRCDIPIERQLRKRGDEVIHTSNQAPHIVKSRLDTAAAVGNLLAAQRLQNLLYVSLLDTHPERTITLEVDLTEKENLSRTQTSAANRRDKTICIRSRCFFYARKRSYPVQVRARRK